MFLFLLIHKCSYVLRTKFIDVSEMFVSGVSSMYIYLMHCLNFFLSCSIKNLTLATLSHLYTIKSDVNFPFYKF